MESAFFFQIPPENLSLFFLQSTCGEKLGSTHLFLDLGLWVISSVNMTHALRWFATSCLAVSGRKNMLDGKRKGGYDVKIGKTFLDWCLL